MTVRCRNVPVEALEPLASQLRHFGAVVKFGDYRTGGIISHVSGVASFDHAGDILTVKILHNPGHFPHWLLVGGIKQLVEETVEALPKPFAWNPAVV